MSYHKTITGSSVEDVCRQVSTHLATAPDILIYEALIQKENRDVYLNIDIDISGCFEGWIQSTKMYSKLSNTNGFHFAIYHGLFSDEIERFLVMNHISLGHPEFDEKVVVKTNDETKIKLLFNDDEIRKTFQALNGYVFGIAKNNTEKDSPYLELKIDESIIDTNRLDKIYHAFYKVLVLLDAA